MARQKLVGGQNLKIFRVEGAKRYTQTFLLHFSITILVNFWKVGGNCPLIPPPGHATVNNLRFCIILYSNFRFPYFCENALGISATYSVNTGVLPPHNIRPKSSRHKSSDFPAKTFPSKHTKCRFGGIAELSSKEVCEEWKNSLWFLQQKHLESPCPNTFCKILDKDSLFPHVITSYLTFCGLLHKLDSKSKFLVVNFKIVWHVKWSFSTCFDFQIIFLQFLWTEIDRAQSETVRFFHYFQNPLNLDLGRISRKCTLEVCIRVHF